MLHGLTLCDCFLCWDIEGHQHGLQCMSKPLNERPTVFGWNHQWQQRSLTDSENNLRSTDADQVGIPVTQDCVRLAGIRLRLDFKTGRRKRIPKRKGSIA